MMSRRVPQSEPRVPLGLESHFEPVRHESLYRIAPNIIETLKPYHDDNVVTQSAGMKLDLSCILNYDRTGLIYNIQVVPMTFNVFLSGGDQNSHLQNKTHLFWAVV